MAKRNSRRECEAHRNRKSSHVNLSLRVILFWVAFILTRPLGAVVGDFLDKPRDQGGLALSCYTASLALLVVIVALILIFPQRPASKAH